MPLNLSAIAIVEKNKLGTDSVWSMLLDISMLVGGPVDLRVTNDTSDISFGGNTYQKFSFDFDAMNEQAQGEVPEAKLIVSNANRVIEGLLASNNGGADGEIILYIVNSANPTGEADLSMTFRILESTADAQWVSFRLGAENLNRIPLPRYRYTFDNCWHVYNTPTMQAGADPRGVMCGYAGAIVSCDKTLDGANGCRIHTNAPRFGGFPSIDRSGFKVF